MIAEYSHYYGGPPAPDTPWPLVLDHYAKTPRFEARRHLTGFDSVREAITVSLSSNGSGDPGSRIRRALARRAYPWMESPESFQPNLAAQDLETTDDG